jgi:hypothetical protein
MHFLERVDDRSGVVHQRLPGHKAGQNDDYADVEQRTNDERGDDADRNVALRILALFGGGRNGVEADVGEENDRSAGENSGPAIGRERMPVRRVDVVRRETDEDKDRDDFHQHHDVVGLGGFANAAHENHGEEHHDDEGGPVETKVPAGLIERVACEVAEAARQVCRGDPFQIRVNAEPVEQIDDVGGEADADGHVADGVFEDEVPADDPGDEFTHGGVGVRVSAAGDGNHCGKLGVADRSESADDGDEDEGKSDRGTGAGTPEAGGVVNQVFEERRIENRGSFEFLAGDRGADDGEDAGADHGADSEGSEAEPAEGLLEFYFRVFGVGQKLIDAFTVEKLRCHSLSPIVHN